MTSHYTSYVIYRSFVAIIYNYYTHYVECMFDSYNVATAECGANWSNTEAYLDGSYRISFSRFDIQAQRWTSHAY